VNTLNIHQLLSCEPNVYLDILRKENNPLFPLVFDFKNYVDGYAKKIGYISSTLQSQGDSSNPSRFESKLKDFNRPLIVVKSINEVDGYLDEVFMNAGKIEEDLSLLKHIMSLVIKYIINQEEYLKKYNEENSFREHIGVWIGFINEEASVLFCYLVKETFEFMDAPEKQAIAQLNRYVLPFLKEKLPDDLETMMKQTVSVIESSTTTFELFHDLIRLLKRITGIRCIQLLSVEPGTKEIEVKLYAYVDHLPMYDVAHAGGVIAEAVEKKKAIRVNSVYEYPGYDIFDAAVKSELAAPVWIGREIYGVLNFEDDHINRFSREFVDAIQRICECISKKLDSFPDKYSLKKERVT